jgi:hypothetical protein
MLGGASLSATANAALRQAVALEAHRVALRCWIDELAAAYGSTTPEEAEAIDQFVEDLIRPPTAPEVA